MSTSNNSWSSRLFNSFLTFVNIFWIFIFNCSLFVFIFSKNDFNKSNDCCKLFDNSSKYLIFSFILFFFSSLISSIKQASQSLCLAFLFFLIFAMHAPQHNWLWDLQKYSSFIWWFFSLQISINISSIPFSILNIWCFSHHFEWKFSHLLTYILYILHNKK